MSSPSNEQIASALTNDKVIDITTIGRKTGQPRRIEIWFRQVNGRVYITGTPGKRDWYANILQNPHFVFHLKESTQADLPAQARPITNTAERREIFSAPVMAWYHSQVNSVNDLIQGSPLIEVIFDNISGGLPNLASKPVKRPTDQSDRRAMRL